MRVRAAKTLPAGAYLPYLDKLEAEGLDLLQNPVEGGLIGDRTTENRLDRLDLGIKALECRQELLAKPASDPNLVSARSHG